MTSQILPRRNEASSPQAPQIVARALAFFAALTTCAVPFSARADEVAMQNGDRYYGKVLSLTTNSLVLQSEVLGRVNLPRAKVQLVTLGTDAPTNSARLTVASSPTPATINTNATTNWSATLRNLRADTNLIQQVQSDYLSAATPEAKQRFNQTLSDLASGKLTVNDLRAEARTAADQLRAFKRELGENAGSEIDDYLNILDRFLRESDSSAGATAKPVGPAARPPSASEKE